MNNELYPKVKQTTIGDLICDMANCVDHVKIRSVQVLAHCPEDEDNIKKKDIRSHGRSQRSPSMIYFQNIQCSKRRKTNESKRRLCVYD